MSDEYLAVALDKRIEQARKRVTYPGSTDTSWTIELLGSLADEAEAAQRHLRAPTGLPRNEDGDIITSASYGELWIVKIQYNTDHENRRIDEDDEATYAESTTFHGPFDTQQEAADWCNAYPEDTDVDEMYVWNMNRVRPA